jgi:glycosyltransferase involved in cell wall biosynthesis
MQGVSAPKAAFDVEVMSRLESAVAERQVFGTFRLPVLASVIIVTYNTDPNLLRQNLQSLKDQSDQSFEIIIVDNGSKSASPIASMFTCEYVRLTKNFGPQVGRNVGTMDANGELCIFLDDDAIPAPGFVKGHLQAHQSPGVLAVRGRCLGRTDNQINLIAFHYDLGPLAKPSLIDLEGNSSFRRDLLIRAGGFDMDLPVQGGGEGTELSLRLIEMNKGGASIYDPRPLIYHDYSTDPIKLLKKYIRQGRVQRNEKNAKWRDSRLVREYGQHPVDILPFIRKVIEKRAYLAFGVFLLGSLASRIF